MADRLLERDGRSVTYTQASTTVTGITSTPMDEEYSIWDGEGGHTKIQSNDWIFKLSDLDGLTPFPGDRITETRNGVERVYEVMPIDKRPCVEDHDSGGVMVVVHSKRIS